MILRKINFLFRKDVLRLVNLSLEFSSPEYRVQKPRNHGWDAQTSPFGNNIRI